MKLSIPVLAVLAATASAAEMKACSRTDMNGSCTSKTSLGKKTGTWRSYKWSSSAERCVRVCNGCTSLGYRCGDYSNSNISFNKFIIFAWAGGDGPENTTCC
ncbi:uncharacterized protein DNG_04388 [Cephalotrichum gorgonifer]|uniref:Uncharacterized protein n=1 Tax=Cephalotrichum gorgonifer TaxID=2041049 RepID=A0AAE8MWN3_9PEZI|nr:uncharacterized protein DNG_04388 [Cephalotrichum gorgonifer]